MGSNRVYGYCVKCKKWVPRDDMRSINVAMYDEHNVAERIRLRFCPACAAGVADYLRDMRWTNELKKESELEAELGIVNG